MQTRHVLIGVTAALGLGIGLGLSRLPLHLGASSAYRSASLQSKSSSVNADVREAPHNDKGARTPRNAAPSPGLTNRSDAWGRTKPRPHVPEASATGGTDRPGVLVLAPGAVKLSAAAPPVDDPPSTNAAPTPSTAFAGADRERIVAFPIPTRLALAIRPHVVASPAAPRQPEAASRIGASAAGVAVTPAATSTGGARLAPHPAPKPTETLTPSPSATPLPSATPTLTPSPSATPTLSPSPSATPTLTATLVVSAAPTLAGPISLTAPSSSITATTVLTGTAAVEALRRDPAAAAVERAHVASLTTKPVQRSYISYVVQPGDTVASIAKRFHDVAWLIRRRNGGLWSMTPGQAILVWHWPFGVPSYTLVPADFPQTYTVKSGDNLGAIATALRTDVAALVSENGLADGGNVLSLGQTLTLHHYSTTVKQRVFVPGVSAEQVSTGLLLTDIANMVGTDAALMKGLVWHETGWTMVRGASGEIGMVQIMPYMSAWVEKTLVGYPLDPHTRKDNILEGTLLLQYYLDATRGDVHKSLALYHSGNMLADSRNGDYLNAILALRAYYYHNPRAGF